MLMDSFEVENFRSLKHLKLEKLARVNLLVGKNNSGKTSALEALFLLAGLGSAHGFAVIDKERKLSGGNFRYLFYNFDADGQIKMRSTYYDENGKSNAQHDSTLSTVITAAESQDAEGHETLSSVRKTFIVSDLQVQAQLANDTRPIIFRINRVANGQLTISPTPSQVMKKMGKDFYFPAAARHSTTEIITTTIDRELLSQKVEALKVLKSLDSVVDILKGIDSRIKSIELGISGEIYLDLGAGFATLLPFNLMGEGFQRLLDITSAIANVSGGIVLIDEIDNGLHYSALRVLWKGVLQAAHKYDVQVFATTHSAEALRHLTWVLDDDCKEYCSDVAAYTLIRADDDTVRTYRHDYEQLDYALDHGVEIRN